MDRSQRIIELKNLINKAQIDLIYAESQLLKAKSLKMEVENNISKYKDEQRALRESHIDVSDHAIVQFIKRVADIDIDSIKKEILQCEELKSMLDGKYDMTHDSGKKYTLLVKNNVVVTITV